MTSASTAMQRNPLRGMRRYPEQGYIAGVCEGIARHFDWNPRTVRLVAVVLLVFTGFWPTGVAYLLAWYILDRPAPHEVHLPVVAVPGPAPSERLAALERRLRALEAYVVSEEFRLRRELGRLKD